MMFLRILNCFSNLPNTAEDWTTMCINILLLNYISTWMAMVNVLKMNSS